MHKANDSLNERRTSSGAPAGGEVGDRGTDIDDLSAATAEDFQSGSPPPKPDVVKEAEKALQDPAREPYG
jgi:hypothetical protein